MDKIWIFYHEHCDVADPCPEDYTLVYGQCYRPAFGFSITLAAAQSACDEDGATLVSLETEEERDAILSWLQTGTCH